MDRVRRRLEVDPGSGGQLELVAAECGLDRLGSERPLQGRAELADERPKRRVPGGWRLPTPQDLRQLLARDGPPVLGGEDRKEQPALPPREVRLGDETF